jgi:putative transposase
VFLAGISPTKPASSRRRAWQFRRVAVEKLQRTFKYRLYPTVGQAERLEEQLSFNQRLYNAALEQRRSLWRDHGVSVSYNDQARQLTELRREAGAAPQGMNCWAQQEALKRLDRAFQAFFRRVKRGETPGYPRFRAAARYDTITWSFSGNAGGVKLDERLHLQGIGAVKVKWDRRVPEDATLKQVRVTRHGSGRKARWYASVSPELPKPAPLPRTGRSMGIDLGIASFAALSTGELVKGPRALRAAKGGLARAQRRCARKKRGSKRRRKAADQVARRHERVRNVRRDHAAKLATRLVAENDVIAVEKLNVRGLARGRLAYHVNDAAWGDFVKRLHGKAEEAGRSVIEVDPRFTSQTCNECGTRESLALADREFACSSCGQRSDRDVNAARNIHARGIEHFKGPGRAFGEQPSVGGALNREEA